jgi:GTP:adenosylcobinamide-phosphate guanylyltransferase
MISKLNEWYEENITAIEENRWVINVDSHRKTQRLIKEFMFKFA